MLSTWISKLFGKSADTNIYIAKIQIAHSRHKDRRVPTKANIQQSSTENWISRQFIEEHNLLAGEAIADEQLEDMVKTFTWYYCVHKDGRTYDCEFTSNFRITNQRGYNVLFGADPTKGDVNGGENPFQNVRLKKRKSWKPHPSIASGSSGGRSQSSSIVPRLLDDAYEDIQAATQSKVDSTYISPTNEPKDHGLHQTARRFIPPVTFTHTTKPHDAQTANLTMDQNDATRNTIPVAACEAMTTATPAAALVCHATPLQDRNNAAADLLPWEEGVSNAMWMNKDSMPTVSDSVTKMPDKNQPSVIMARYLRSPLELAALEDGDRTGRPSRERIKHSKPRKRREKSIAGHDRQQFSSQQQLEADQDSEYWQYDEKTGGYYHKDAVSNDIVWYPVLD